MSLESHRREQIAGRKRRKAKARRRGKIARASRKANR